MNMSTGLSMNRSIARVPTMGPSYRYSWAVDFSRAPALDSSGGAFWNLGGTAGSSFPYSDEFGDDETQGSHLASGFRVPPATVNGFRVESKEDSGNLGSAVSQNALRLGFPHQTSSAMDDALKFFKPHATHDDGIPVGAFSSKYKYFSMVLTIFSEIRQHKGYFGRRVR